MPEPADSDGVAIIARAAGEQLSFEQLRQELQNVGAPDPLLFAVGCFDVEPVVLKLLGPDTPADCRERGRFALLRALSAHPHILGMRHQQDRAAPQQPDSAMQSMLAARDDFFARWWDFQEGMRRVGPMICQVCIDGRAAGTGFLVGERHVLTSHHCLTGLLTEAGRPAPGSRLRLSVVFDNMVVPGTVSDLFKSTFRVVEEWLIDASAKDELEGDAPTPLDTIAPGRLDFALILLDEAAGLSAPRQQPNLARKWIDMTALAPMPKPDMQMLIAHHPGGADLRLSVGLFGNHSNCALRVRYRTPTVIGSSGAPCFTIDWKPYALHNAGYAAVLLNQGVPLSLIAAALVEAHGSVNFAAPPPALLALRTADGAPILDREAVARQVDAMLLGHSAVRALVVNAPPGAGKTFTGEQIRSLVIARGHTAFLLDAEKFAGDSAEAFAARLVREIVRDVAQAAPPSPDYRQRARWVTQSLSNWAHEAMGRAAGGADAAPARRRLLLIILDRCDAAPLPQETHDLLVALLSEPDDAAAAVSVRFVLLGFEGDLLAVPQAHVWRIDLDLLSVPALLPFMSSVLTSLNMDEPRQTTETNAGAWLEGMDAAGCKDIPGVCAGLLRWEATRRNKAARR
nr:trypsin-like peptidase domain-containing protein [uncultured Duganella sp.]